MPHVMMIIMMRCTDDDGETDYGHDDGDYVDNEDIAAYIACC